MVTCSFGVQGLSARICRGEVDGNGCRLISARQQSDKAWWADAPVAGKDSVLADEIRLKAGDEAAAEIILGASVDWDC
jgi:hypothetical protein